AKLTSGLKAGMSWQGGTLGTRRHTRSLNLDECVPVLRSSGCHFVCLHGEDSGNTVRSLRSAGLNVHWWPEATQDFEEMAALIAALDVVISVPCSSAHLGGALGKPLWLMLSASPEWRYLSRGSRMPWYPSAVLFRQRRSGDWSEVVQQVQ